MISKGYNDVHVLPIRHVLAPNNAAKKAIIIITTASDYNLYNFTALIDACKYLNCSIILVQKLI